MSTAAAPSARRYLFVATILTGSFLLFLVQPMVARMALPRLGGAPNVWNSAMLVYQALLLGGYAYAHVLGKLPLRRQAGIHLSLLILAMLTLPVRLVDLPPSAAGWEVVWVPALLALSIGPVFFLVSAQAPLMQRWYTASPAAGEPWALYAASNLGSFAGLIAYPLLAEPLLRLEAQSLAWSLGYGLLIVLVALAAWARWRSPVADEPATEEAVPPVPVRRILLWLILAAVPSGLMLSTTTHLTTDIFAMPLLWVIPLGVYLLSFVVAFSDRRQFARTVQLTAPSVMLLAGGMAMVSHNSATMMLVIASIGLLFVVAVALHARLYDLRPHPSQLTLFYLALSGGGALGGLFTALIAPTIFDWVWEHPLLVIAAALLMPLVPLLDWRNMHGLDPGMARIASYVLLAAALLLGWFLVDFTPEEMPGPIRLYLTLAMAFAGLLLVPSRVMFMAVLLVLMLAQGGLEILRTTWDGARIRSYFGIYTIQDYPDTRLRTLAHGTTLHGQQSTDPARALTPTTYYGPGSGVGMALGQAQAMYGPGARIGVVGLGTGTLACYHRPGEHWRFYEIDPAVLRLSRDRIFTYLADCAPDAQVVLGDARLELGKSAPGSLDIIAIDAFSSDAIPLHLLTDEAFRVYLRALSPKGMLAVHISNRYIELEPVLGAIARQHRLAALIREDHPHDRTVLSSSSWVLLTRDPAQLKRLAIARPDAPLEKLDAPAPRAWTDDHASILPYVRWTQIWGKP
ncbi:fused MFS/spermidine synthase [Tsuneonella sp. CC-YZS046]|uniref:spermidine synthase n=1 Tax=Tsuneonella sp. CC-YZS046 TaxID=3042152 RepID=UPI002D7912B3|nr:fused MFS/spermidine synthase [Tsuneonella sp. CC-YZS046]WRO65947.1 fused MFS/spermidine synthase [Tsuneonella sp. CC-YZS046]